MFTQPWLTQDLGCFHSKKISCHLNLEIMPLSVSRSSVPSEDAERMTPASFQAASSWSHRRYEGIGPAGGRDSAVGGSGACQSVRMSKGGLFLRNTVTHLDCIPSSIHEFIEQISRTYYAPGTETVIRELDIKRQAL